MKINNKQLINLPVITQSGQQLGIVESFNVEIETQSILEYIVKPSSLVKELISGELVVPRGQIIDITQDNIIIKDSFSKAESYKKLNKALKEKKAVALNKEQIVIAKQ